VQRPIAQRPRQLFPTADPASKAGQPPAAGQHRTDCPSPIVVRAWLRGDDSAPTSVGLPLQRIDGDLPRLPDCRDDRSTTCRDSDLASHYRYDSAIALTVITLGCILLITLLSALAARRLFGIRIPFAGRFTPSASNPRDASQLLDAELELLEMKKANALAVTSKDESDWRAVNCRHIYQRMWKAVTTEEQLLLHQLAGRQYANPENQIVIERLLRRGYLTLAPWPRIVEPGFADFVRTVQPDELLGRLKYETTHSLWGRLRTPLLVVVAVVAGLLMWLAGSTMHILAGALAGVAALFGSIAQVTNFIHRDKPPSG
jgi:hypothetical protein